MPLPNLQQRLEALIATPSVSSVDPAFDMGNRDIIDLLASWLEELGFSIDIQPVAENKANLIARFGHGTGGLVLSGHTDTVPYNESRWQSNPLTLTEKNNRFYGLGTCDMKGFFSLVIEAFTRIKDQPFQHPLTLIATCDEESTMYGAKALLDKDLQSPKAVVIGEPTSLKPIRMHKSIMMNRITLTGKSGHSSDPSLGNNAIDAMNDLLTELKRFRAELKKDYKQADFAVAYPTLNFGCIHGGDNPNRICNSCALDFDFRGLPGMKNHDMREILKQRLAPVAEETGVTFSLNALFEGVEAFEEARTSPLVTLTESISNSESQAVAFATEAPFYKKMGIDTLVFGPGSIDQAHQPDEFLAFDQITSGVSMINQLIQHYCLKA